METLSSNEIEKVIGPRSALVALSDARIALGVASGDRPRVYAYLSRGESAGQIVKLSSAHYVDKYADFIEFAWVSGATVADLVGPA